MWALDFLGLDTNADEKAIKRAYAKLLKVTRPDDDPIAFQKLNEAYQAALTWRKNTPLTHEILETTEAIATLTSENTTKSNDLVELSHTQATSTIKEGQNHHALYKKCMQLIALEDSNQLQQWLTQCVTPLNDEQRSNFSTLLTNNWGKYFPPVPIQFFDMLVELLAFEKSAQMLVLRSQLNNIWLAKQPHNGDPNITNTLPTDTSLDINLLCQQCIDIAQQNDLDQLYQWFYKQQNQWSLEQKQIIGQHFIDFLSKTLPAMHKKCFSIIMDFFDFNTISESEDIDYQKLIFLENNLHQLWIFDKQRIAQLKANDHNPPNRFSQKPIDPYENWQLLEQLHKPFSWLQATFASIPIPRAKGWGVNLLQILKETNYETPNDIDERQLRFWLKFNQENVMPLIIAPLTLICLAVFLISLPLSFLAWNNTLLLTNSFFSSITAITITFCSFTAIILVVLLFYWYCFWLSMPCEDIDNRFWRIFSVLWIPILLLIWFFFCPDSPSPWQWPLLIFSLFTAIYRFFGYIPNVFYNPFYWPFAIFQFIKKNIIYYKQKKTLSKTTQCLFFIMPIIVLLFMGDIQNFKINTDLPPFIFIITLILWFLYIKKLNTSLDLLNRF